MMKILLESWNKFLFEKDNTGLLPLDVINFIVKKYSKQPNIRAGYFKFNQLGKEFDDTIASYLIPSKTIMINANIKDLNPGAIIHALIHEIQHANQEYYWENDPNYKYKLSKGYKIPKNIDTINWINITKFWNRIYSYDERPQEKDAMNFAEKNYKETFRLVIEREKELKKFPKDATI